MAASRKFRGKELGHNSVTTSTKPEHYVSGVSTVLLILNSDQGLPLVNSKSFSFSGRY
jgi:hypothetical protein